jgi:hypothetical protein
MTKQPRNLGKSGAKDKLTGGWETPRRFMPNHPSVDRNTSFTTWPATPIASLSLTIACYRSQTTRLPSAGRTTRMAAGNAA